MAYFVLANLENAWFAYKLNIVHIEFLLFHVVMPQATPSKTCCNIQYVHHVQFVQHYKYIQYLQYIHVRKICTCIFHI